MTSRQPIFFSHSAMFCAWKGGIIVHNLYLSSKAFADSKNLLHKIGSRVWRKTSYLSLCCHFSVFWYRGWKKGQVSHLVKGGYYLQKNYYYFYNYSLWYLFTQLVYNFFAQLIFVAVTKFYNNKFWENKFQWNFFFKSILILFMWNKFYTLALTF